MFYQSWVKQKRARLRVHSIQVGDRVITEETELRDSAVHFFQGLLAPAGPMLVEPDLSLLHALPDSTELSYLSAPPDDDEVKKAVWSISADSALGPDGFTASFYHKCWDVIGKDVVEAVMQFFNGAFLPRSITSTMIVLLPKKDNPNKPSPNVALKLDMAKAYDRVQWDFLLKVIRCMGFPESWVGMIERCVGSCWFSILVNGAPSGFFKSTRGLRQGDSISPALFVLAADYLSRALDKLICGKKDMVFKSTRGCSEVSHLAYAEDVIIFTQAATETIRRIKGCLDTYSDVSENNEDWASSIEREGGFSKGSFPFLYLGVPIFKGAKRTDMFLFLRDKIARRVNGWAHRHLSFGGRLTLIKSTLEAILIHVFQDIEPTKGALKALEQQMASFFWGAVEEKRKTHWIGWEQICLPTVEGGLGLRRKEDVLKAFNAKLWWRFREQNSLWATHMYAKYCSRKSPLASVGSSRNSATWRRLTAAWPTAHQNMRWIIGEEKILFWDDIWLGDKPLRELCLDTRGRSTSRAADFWSEGHWDHAKIWLAQHQLGLPTQVAEEILSVPILTGSADIPRWTLDRKGEFTVTSAWEAFRAHRMAIPALGDLWNEGLTGSMSIFMWRLMSNRIPVDAKLQWRNISLASKCQCCSERLGNETLQHLFIEGQGASQVWRFFDCWFEGKSEPLLHSDSIPTRLERWAKRTRQTAMAHLARVVPCLVFWFLWAERTNCRYNGVRFRAYSVIW
ncbi:uncharacterized protein LOC121764212 [Salvia splendens]|uniref:uncharacterized protein LOC121764212 n=1 Tax=Salvia splendens TaxID=180675 RepID=UPI001C275272|nr:uncharacterized protein LOC121764212 [Salvia splendens]